MLNKLRTINPNTSIEYEDESFNHDDLINPENYSEPDAGPNLTDEEMTVMEKAAHGALEDEDEQVVLQDNLERVLEEPAFNPGHDVIPNGDDGPVAIPFTYDSIWEESHNNSRRGL